MRRVSVSAAKLETKSYVATVAILRA